MYSVPTFFRFAGTARALLATLLLAFRLPAVAQAPAWQSARAVAVAAVGAANHSSVVRATALDATGNVYLAGAFTNTVVLGGTTLTSLGSFDVFVAKFSPARNQFVWAQRAGSTGFDEATALAVSGTSVYVAGYYAGTAADFGGVTLPNAGSNDAFVAKLTDAGPTGGFAWAQRAGGAEYDAATALAVSGNSVYLAGQFLSVTAGFGATLLANADATSATDDVFVAKLLDAGPTGSFVWAQRAGGANIDRAYALAVVGSSVYVAGRFNGPEMRFGLTVLGNVSRLQTFDVFVAKLTDAGPTGSFAWAQQAGGTADDEAYALAVGSSVYVVGYYFSSSASFGATTLSNPSSGLPLAYLAALADPAPTATAAAGPRAAAALFPNPARHAVTLRLPAGAAPSPLTLSDARGRTVRHYPAPDAPETALNLRGLPAGLYLLRGAGPARQLIVE